MAITPLNIFFIGCKFKNERARICAKNTRACLDPNFKKMARLFYSNLSKCGTRVNKAQSPKLL